MGSITSLNCTNSSLGKNSMDFVGGLPTNKKGNNYVFLVVDMFNMCILMPYKNTINGKEATNMFFGQFWVHFRVPRMFSLNGDTIFPIEFLAALWEKMHTKLKRFTTFNP